MNTESVWAGPRGRVRIGRAAALAAALLVYAASAPASAMEGSEGAGVSGASFAGTRVSGTRVLAAADHAELAADIAASGVVRIALVGDRIARVVRPPEALRVEHDPASGDLYVSPLRGEDGTAGPEPGVVTEPRALFIGTEKGFTYRLALTPAPAGASQILIRNPAAASSSAPERTVDGRVGALVGLIRAAARGEAVAGYAVHPGGGFGGSTVIETWRETGAFPRPRFTALVFEAGPSAPGGAEDAADLAGTVGGLPGEGPLAALWLAAPGTGPSGGRLAVAVRESAPAGDTRAGGSR